MTPFETIETDEIIAACNGGGGPLGHPRVYLNLTPIGHADCPYCSRRYINQRAATADPHIGVAMPSAVAAGAERPGEQPAPRQPGSR